MATLTVASPSQQWTLVLCSAGCRLGSIARKHGSYASCVRMTNTLYGFNAMEVQEAFVKIREQVCSHHAPEGTLRVTFAFRQECCTE